MHSLKVLARARRSLHKLGTFPHRRSFSALPHYASSDDLQDQVLVDGRANSRTAILNRPSALNSLTTSMVARLKRLYESWEENPNIGFVLMKGSGKAFCSGGDVVTLYHLLTEAFFPSRGSSRISSECRSFLPPFPFTWLSRIEVIDKCFSHDTAEEIIHALDIEAAESYDEWCAMILKKLREASPLSLKVTLRSICECRFQTLDQCLTREYRISLCGISGEVSKDFCEGVWARLVDKDFAPKWDPPSLDEVMNKMVDFYVSPLLSEPELELPTALREPFV